MTPEQLKKLGEAIGKSLGENLLPSIIEGLGGKAPAARPAASPSAAKPAAAKPAAAGAVSRAPKASKEVPEPFCESSVLMLKEARNVEASTAWDRLAEQKPQCTFGSQGLCCRHCAMGPCRIKPNNPDSRGVCGATADTIAARHFCRMIAAGAASHSDHGRSVAETMIKIGKGEAPGFGIKDEAKLMAVAIDYGIDVEGKDNLQIAVEIGEKGLAMFGQQEGELLYIKKAPLARQKIWKEQGVTPRGIDREVVEIMHRTHMGVDHDIENLMVQGCRASLSDGWGGAMLATDMQDIMFGTPVPVLSTVDLGTLSADKVNIIVHGHEPLLSEMIVAASMDPEMIKYAESKGAKGINLGGICCTANEVLMRHGIAIAGNFLQQELAILTGAVEAMVVDVQCIMPSLPTIAGCHHTKIVSTNPKAKFEGAEHIEFHEDNAIESAKKIVKAAIDNFTNRKETNIPDGKKTSLVGGFSHETINYLLGGMFRASYKPLNDNIINGRIRGIAGVVGCNNPKVSLDGAHVEVVKELIKNDVIVLMTGCAAISCAKAGLLVPEAAAKFAGPGLAEVCQTVGIPPVLHMGSCVDNSRILMAATAVVKEGGLGDDLCDLPAAGSAPEWMSEKAIAIGQYFVTSGVYTVFGNNFPTFGSEKFTDLLFKGMENKFGGMWDYEADPIAHAHKIIDHIDRKRKELGIDKKRDRVLLDMADRQKLE